MTIFKSINRLIIALSVAVVTVIVIAGCSPAQHKKQADEEVYSIIDQKWDQSIANKANYTITGVHPGPNDIAIVKYDPQKGSLSLNDAVALATKNNRQYQTQKEQLYLVALDLTLERHSFARQWFGTVDAGYLRNEDDESVSSGTTFGFDRLLADGTRISTDIAFDWMRFLTGDPDTSLASVLTASFTKPLLRGAGRKIAQENLTQAERNALYQIREFNRYRKQFVVSVITGYYRVLQQANEVVNAENNYDRRVQLRKRSEAEAKAGKTPQFEVEQAMQTELSAKNSFVRTQRNYQETLDSFKLILAIDTDEKLELDPNELKALANLGVQEPEYSLHNAIETGLLLRLDLLNSADKIDDAARKAIVAEDNLGAELNLIGSASVPSTEDTDMARLRFHDGTYKLGIQADLPFDRKAQRNAYTEALISLEQKQRQYKQDYDEVILDIRQAYRDLKEAKIRYEIQKNSLQLAQKRVDSMPLLLKTGRAQTRDILDAQDSLVQAQNDLAASLIDYNIAKMSFFRDIGILQVTPDGMWQK